MAGRRKSQKTEYYFDYSLLFIILFLTGFGLVMIYSASAYDATTQNLNEDYYLMHQAFAAALGLFGGIAVILIFLLLIWRLMIIANNASDLFGALLVVGVLGHIAIQVILNVAVVTNSMPNTGVSLPFISYGGSSILFLLIEMGLVMSVARGIKVRDV